MNKSDVEHELDKLHLNCYYPHTLLSSFTSMYDVALSEKITDSAQITLRNIMDRIFND